MAEVINLKNYVNAKETKIRSYSILDKILDPTKKKEADNYYNKNYEYIEKDNFCEKLLRK